MTGPARSLPSHVLMTKPSAWVTRWLSLLPPNGRILDLACGAGRHSLLLLERGHSVTAIDKDIHWLGDALAGRKEAERVELLEADLENGSPFPLTGRRFEGVVVTNYLFRPLMPALLDCLAEGGVLIYETFAVGNEAFSRPRNPDHLLREGELLETVRGRLQVISFEQGRREGAPPSVVQRICAQKGPHPQPIE